MTDVAVNTPAGESQEAQRGWPRPRSPQRGQPGAKGSQTGHLVCKVKVSSVLEIIISHASSLQLDSKQVSLHTEKEWFSIPEVKRGINPVLPSPEREDMGQSNLPRMATEVSRHEVTHEDPDCVSDTEPSPSLAPGKCPRPDLDPGGIP